MCHGLTITSINVQYIAVDVIRFVTGQNTPAFTTFSESRDGLTKSNVYFYPRRCPHGADHVRHDESKHHGVDVDAFSPKFFCPCFRYSDDSCFRRHLIRLAENSIASTYSRRIDDLALFLFEHGWEHCLHQWMTPFKLMAITGSKVLRSIFQIAHL